MERRLAFLACLLSIALGVLITHTPRLDNVAVPALAAGLLGAGTAVIAVYVWRSNAFSLLPMVTGYFMLTFAIGGLYYRWPRADGGSGALAGFRGSYTPDGLVLAVAIGLLAWALFTAAFLAARPLRACRRLPRPSVSPAHAGAVIAILFAIGWLARLLAVQRGLYFHFSTAPGEATVTKSGNVIAIVANVPLMATALAGIFRGSVPRWWYWTSLLAEVAWALPSGERSRLVAIGLLVLLVRYYSPQPLPKRAALAGVLVVVLVLFPFGASYRGAGGATGYQQETQQQLVRAADETLSRPPTEMVSVGIEETVSRFSGAASLASMMTQGRQHYPVTPERAVRIYAGAFVPRFVLPTKDNPVTITNEFGRSYGILHYRAVNTSSIAVTQPGDLFGTFGWLGLVLGMLGIGALARGIDEFFHDRRANPATLAVWATSVGGLILGFDGTVAVGFLQSLKEILVFCVVLAAAATAVRLAASGLRVHRRAAYPPRRWP